MNEEFQGNAQPKRERNAAAQHKTRTAKTDRKNRASMEGEKKKKKKKKKQNDQSQQNQPLSMEQ